MEGYIPTRYSDLYNYRTVKILETIKADESAPDLSTIKIVDPIARKGDTVFDLNEYRYEDSLRKGQIVTVFLEKIASGEYSMQQAGTAQIKQRLPQEYINNSNKYALEALLDIYLHGEKDMARLIGELNTTFASPIGMKEFEVTTPNRTYHIDYLESPESNLIFISVDLVTFTGKLEYALTFD